MGLLYLELVTWDTTGLLGEGPEGGTGGARDRHG